MLAQCSKTFIDPIRSVVISTALEAATLILRSQTRAPSRVVPFLIARHEELIQVRDETNTCVFMRRGNKKKKKKTIWERRSKFRRSGKKWKCWRQHQIFRVATAHAYLNLLFTLKKKEKTFLWWSRSSKQMYFLTLWNARLCQDTHGELSYMCFVKEHA